MAAGVDYKGYRRALSPATASGINSAATTEPNFLWKQRNYVLLQATLAATVTYSAGMSPPGWLLIDNGDALQVTYPHRFEVFFYFNATAFIASIVIINLILFHSLIRPLWWLRALQAAVILNQFSLLGAYAAGSCRDVAMSTYAVALVSMVSLYVCAHVLSFLRRALRTHDGCKNLAPSDDQAPETEEPVPNVFLIISPLVATATYQAGLSTPCGFLSDSKNGDHLAGDPMLHGHHPDSFMPFFYFNLTAFVASLVITMLIISGTATRTRIWLWVSTGVSLIGLTGAAIGSSSSVVAPINVVVFIAMVTAITLYMVVHSLISAASDRRVHAVSDPQVTDADQLLTESRKDLFLLATLAASVTYQAGLNPPGGFWQQNAAHDYIAGDPIHDITNPPTRIYLVFLYCNATAFVASLVILILLVNNILSNQVKWLAIKVSMILDILGLVVAFAAGSCRKVSISVYISAAVLAVAVFLYVGIRAVVLRLQVFPNRATWWKMLREKLKRSVPDWLKKFFELPPEVEGEDMKWKLEKSRKHLLLLAILAASLTYEAGMSPPGGFWQQNKTGHVVAGHQLVLANDYYGRRYTAFFYSNAVAFIVSLALIMLLQNRKLSSRGILSHALRVCVILDQLIRQAGGFVTRICRKVSISIYVFILVFAVVVCIPLHGILVVPESIPGSQQILLFLFIIMEEEAGHILPRTAVDGPCSESQDLMVVEIESEHDKTTLGGDVWVLDCTARMHYTSDVQLLDDSEALPSFRDEDDDAHILARGFVRTNRFEVPNVSCVRGDARNVISVAQLARSHGLVSVFEPTVGYVRDTSTGKDVGRAYVRECDGVYVLEYLLIGEPQDIVDASVWPCTNSDEMQSGVSELTLELPDRMSWFGMSRSDLDSPKDPTVENAFPMSPYEEQGGTRTKQFYMDSGVCHHMTWNGDVLKAYDGTLNIKPPVESVMGTRDIRSATRVNSDELSHPLKVGGIGYIDSTGGSLDGVLFVPGSDVNLVSVNQVTRDYAARVVFHRDEFWIEKLESKDRIGHGKWAGNSYLVAILDVGAASDWILNSSASIHHTSNRKMLYDFRETAEDVQLEVVGHMKILGHGSVWTERFKVPGIRYTAGDARNVISVVQLANDHGLVTIFEPGFCYVKDKGTGQIVGQGHLRDGVYVLKTLRINQDKGVGGIGLPHQLLAEPPQVAKDEALTVLDSQGELGHDSYESQQQPGQAGTVYDKTMMTTRSAMHSDHEEWVLDTRASSHHTSNPRLLLGGSDLEVTSMDMPRTSVDGPPLNLRHGLVRTKKFEVPDVSYVEGEAGNVISVAQLASSHGLVTVFEPTRCYLKDKKTGQIVGQGHLRDGVYVLDNLLIRQYKEGRPHSEDKGEQKVNDSDAGGRRSGGTSNIRDDKKGQAGGEESGNDSGGGSDSGSSGGGDRDGDGEQGGNRGGREDEKEEEEAEEAEEEEERGGDEEIKNQEGHQQSSYEGLISHPPYESFCPCGKNALLILCGACEECGLEPPKASKKYTYTVPVQDGSSQPSMDFIMDSGAGSHMTWNGDKNFLEKYGPMFRTPLQAVSGIGGSSLPVDGWGQVKTRAILLNEVLHVPGAGVNLVSLSKLADEYSARVVFERQFFLIQKLGTKETIGNGHRMSAHYILDYFWPDDSCRRTAQQIQPGRFVASS